MTAKALIFLVSAINEKPKGLGFRVLGFGFRVFAPSCVLLADILHKPPKPLKKP